MQFTNNLKELSLKIYFYRLSLDWPSHAWEIINGVLKSQEKKLLFILNSILPNMFSNMSVSFFSSCLC